jgi:electron transfer flavoprotein beta subunit
MRILVCIKAVPERDSALGVKASGDFYEEAGLKFRVNDYDLCAMEEAVRVKEKLGEAKITVVSVGPSRVEEQIRKALSLGGAYGVRIDDTAAPARDALSVANLLAAWAGPQKFDLILCGVMSEDLQRGQVGPMLAQLLNYPCATTVISLQLSQDRKKILCERELEQGLREKVELPLPALLTLQTGINIPRWASLSNVLRVKKMEIAAFPAAELGRVQSCEKLVRAYLPERSRKCEFLEGDSASVADRLLSEIRSRVKVL